MCCIKVKVIELRVKVKLACQSFTSVFGYNLRIIGRVGTKLIVRDDIDEGFQLGQGDRVKGQGQIHDLVKKLFWL